MAEKLKKTKKAVYMKLYNLGLLDEEEIVKKNQLFPPPPKLKRSRRRFQPPEEALESLSNYMGRLQLEVGVKREITCLLLSVSRKSQKSFLVLRRF